MGYYASIIIMKKKVLEKAKHLLSKKCTFSELYEDYFYMWEYPDEYNIPEDEVSSVVEIFNENIFDEYFNENPLKNGESRIIPKSIYDDFLKWIEDKIKMTTLYDIAIGQIDDYTANSYIHTYKSLKDLKIDWDTECVVFQNDW